MKTIGLIGGMSWESTVTYYQLLNRMARQRLGDLHSAKLLLWSFDFAEIEAFQASGDWAAATQLMVDAAQSLQQGGADCIVICTNTMHKMSQDVQQAVDLPLIHIADATATGIEESQCQLPLLLATRYTMEQDFYRGHLKNHWEINTAIPDQADRTIVHDIIYNELCQGVVNADSKRQYLEVVDRGLDAGADGVILGCTEIGLLVGADDFPIPVFDTTALHASAALDFALSP